MVFKSKLVGSDFKNELTLLCKNGVDKVIDVRGLGQMNAIEFDSPVTANSFVKQLRKKGILTKSTKQNTIRLTPPLTIEFDNSWRVLEIIEKVLKNL